MLLKLRVRVTRAHSEDDCPFPKDLLTSSAVIVCFSGEVPSSSSVNSAPWDNRRETDLLLLTPKPERLKDLLRDAESTPLLRESATTALRPEDRGESRGPGSILEIECRGVLGLSAVGGVGPR